MQAIIGLGFLPLIGSPGRTKEDLTAEPLSRITVGSLMTNPSYLLHPLFLIPPVNLLCTCATTASNHTVWTGHSSLIIYYVWEESPLLSQIPSLRFFPDHPAILWGFYLLSVFLPQEAKFSHWSTKPVSPTGTKQCDTVKWLCHWMTAHSQGNNKQSLRC